MKVKDVIEKLKEFDPELGVMIASGGCGYEISEIYLDDDNIVVISEEGWEEEYVPPTKKMNCPICNKTMDFAVCKMGYVCPKCGWTHKISEG